MQAPAFEFAAREEPPQRLEPTVEGRVHAYDFIRGIAIFGILLANIAFFATPAMSEMMSFRTTASGQDFTVLSFTTALVAGKYRSMLAILFGIGMWLQYQRRKDIPKSWPGGYLKRMAFLALFGVIHGIFVWYGDILFTYSLAAMALCLFLTFSERVHRWLIGTSGGLALFVAVGAVLAAVFVDVSKIDLGDLASVTPAQEVAAFASGSYADQLRVRGLVFGDSLGSTLFFLPFLGGLMLLGVLLARHRVIESPSQNQRVRNRMLWIGFGIGLPLNLAAGLVMAKKNALSFEIAVEIFAGPMLALGLITLLAVWAESGFLKQLQLAVAKVGRMAFSNYILQSLLCTAVFYSWGWGLFGRLNRLELLLVPPVIWAINVAFSHFWLEHWKMGPLEWLWRSLTEGRRLANRVG